MVLYIVTIEFLKKLQRIFVLQFYFDCDLVTQRQKKCSNYEVQQLEHLSTARSVFRELVFRGRPGFRDLRG